MQPEQFINQSVDVSILALSTSCQADCEDIQPAKLQAELSLVSDEAGYFRRPYVGCVPEVPPEPIIKAPSQLGKERQNRLAVTASAASIIDYTQESEERLLAAARASDERAFLELSSRSSHSLRHMVLRIVRNREDTEDVMQEALLKAYTHLSDFRGTCSFSTWLTRIAINSALTVLRRKKSRSEIPHDQPGIKQREWEVWEFPDPSPDPEQAYSKHQLLELLSSAIRSLPPAQRSVFELRHGHENSLQECADVVGITVAAAKTRLHRARLSLRSILEKRRVYATDVCC